jgi:sugar transferase (PEP-CTERM/EpsH1 system associated)
LKLVLPASAATDFSALRPKSNARPLIAHVVYAFEQGGLENGVVNLINHLPEQEFDHAVISLTTASEEFCSRILRTNVQVIALERGGGQTYKAFGLLWSALSKLKPDIVHTRNISTLECQLLAMLLRVPVRIHGEHGWDVSDVDGTNVRYQKLRRVLKHLTHHQIALSRQITDYLRVKVGISQKNVTRICNGVDTVVFRPKLPGEREQFLQENGITWKPDDFIFGTVGRAKEIKNQLALCEVFVRLREAQPEFKMRAKLAIVGGGPLTASMVEYLRAHDALDSAWLPGGREDVPEVLRMLDLFVLPSHTEGISNAILEAMSTGMPVVAALVGGNPELVSDKVTGRLLKVNSVSSFAETILNYFVDKEVLLSQSHHARQHVVDNFSINKMVLEYATLYKRLLKLNVSV